MTAVHGLHNTGLYYPKVSIAKAYMSKEIRNLEIATTVNASTFIPSIEIHRQESKPLSTMDYEDYITKLM